MAMDFQQLRKPLELTLIIQDGHSSLDKQTRRLIRRKVMLGRNHKKLRKAPLTGSISPEQIDGHSTDHLELSITIPGRVGGDLSFIQLADTIEPQLLAEVVRCRFRHSFVGFRLFCPDSIDAKTDAWPLAPCIAFSKVKGAWLEPIAHDAAYLHMLVSFVHLISSIQGRSSGTTTHQEVVHHQKALGLLRQRLIGPDEVAKTTDHTIIVVMGMATYAVVQGDHTTASHHMQGLRQLVHIRGGLSTFWKHPKLLIELIRADLTIALHTRCEPVLCDGKHDLDDCLPWPGAELRQASGLSSLKRSPSPWLVTLPLDAALKEIWQCLDRFCIAVNHLKSRSLSLSDVVVSRVMGSVMYRLLDLQSRMQPGMESLLCQSLLAFCANIFLQRRNSAPSISDADLRTLFHGLAPASPCTVSLSLWCLVVGLLCGTLDMDPKWTCVLQSKLTDLNIIDCQELRKRLKAQLWIDFIHDRPLQVLCSRLGMTAAAKDP